jgi:cyclic pyranopterin phosphate synthase
MPKEVFGPGYAFLRDPQLMAFAEIAEIARAFVALGVEKVRLTGGEPLLRADLPELVRVLKKELRVRDVALTTNGWLLAQRAAALREAGLDRVSVSLDSLDPVIAGRMNGLGFSVDRVLAGIAAAEQAGLAIKINTVVQRGVNDHEIIPLAEYFRERGHPLRFIEFMDVGNTNHWDRAQVLPAREIVERIHARWPLEPVGPAYRGEVAARYRYVDGRGEIGLISSVTELLPAPPVPVRPTTGVLPPASCQPLRSVASSASGIWPSSMAESMRPTAISSSTATAAGLRVPSRALWVRATKSSIMPTRPSCMPSFGW